MSKEHTTEHLRAELKSLSDTLEEVLSSSGEKSKEELSKIRSKAEQALKQSRYRLVENPEELPQGSDPKDFTGVAALSHGAPDWEMDGALALALRPFLCL